MRYFKKKSINVVSRNNLYLFSELIKTHVINSSGEVHCFILKKAFAIVTAVYLALRRLAFFQSTHENSVRTAERKKLMSSIKTKLLMLSRKIISENHMKSRNSVFGQIQISVFRVNINDQQHIRLIQKNRY